jgi:hypothetical protein
VISAFSRLLNESGDRQSNSGIASAPLHATNKDCDAIAMNEAVAGTP